MVAIARADMDDSCCSPSPAIPTSLTSMSMDELSNWLKADGGIPDKFCKAFTGKPVVLKIALKLHVTCVATVLLRAN